MRKKIIYQFIPCDPDYYDGERFGFLVEIEGEPETRKFFKKSEREKAEAYAKKLRKRRD